MWDRFYLLENCYTNLKLEFTWEKYYEKTDNRSADNRSLMSMAADSMERISDSASASMENIRRLGEESKEIVGIINTITKIFLQTKLLSLNATIEAARAGEHGRGFAVVAEEIRHLSAQTQEAVDDIEAIIREVVKNTEQSVISMGESVELTEQGRKQKLVLE